MPQCNFEACNFSGKKLHKEQAKEKQGQSVSEGLKMFGLRTHLLLIWA
jgi:hypothetical protein